MSSPCRPIRFCRSRWLPSWRLHWCCVAHRRLGRSGLDTMFGLGQFVPGLFWITESFQVEADRFGWLALPAVFGLAGLLSAFPALACVVAARMARSGLPPALSLATAWAASEWLRGHVVTGFPWNLAAYTLADWTVLSQAASVVGSYGLGFLLVLCASLAGLAFGRADRHLRVLRLTGAAAILVSVAGFGVVRLATSGPASDRGTQVRVVQPNIAQNAKWDNTSRKANILRLFSLSARPGSFDLLFGPKPPGRGSLQRIVAHGSCWGGCCPKRVSCSPAARSGKKPGRDGLPQFRPRHRSGRHNPHTLRQASPRALWRVCSVAQCVAVSAVGSISGRFCARPWTAHAGDWAPPLCWSGDLL